MSRICSNVDCDFAGEEQPLESFYLNPGGPMGRCSKCKACVSKQRKAQYKKDRLAEAKKPLACAGYHLIKQSLDNELSKLFDDNLNEIKDELLAMTNTEGVDIFIEYFIDDCHRVIKKLKSLLQVPL